MTISHNIPHYIQDTAHVFVALFLANRMSNGNVMTMLFNVIHTLTNGMNMHEPADKIHFANICKLCYLQNCTDTFTIFYILLLIGCAKLDSTLLHVVHELDSPHLSGRIGR